MPTWLMVLIALLTCLFLLLWAPLRVDIQAGTEAEFSVIVRYLLFKKRLDGEREATVKKVVEEKPTRKTVKKKAAEKTSLRLGIGIEEATDLLAPLWPPIRKLIRSFKLTNIRIRILVGGGDAADIALGYGRLHAAVGAGAALLVNMFRKVRFKTIDIAPDFLADTSRYDLSLTVGVRPIRLLYTAVILMVKALPALLKFMFPKKRGRGAPATQTQS